MKKSDKMLLNESEIRPDDNLLEKKATFYLFVTKKRLPLRLLKVDNA